MKKSAEKIMFSLLAIILVVTLMFSVSAGWFDWVGKLFGKEAQLAPASCTDQDAQDLRTRGKTFWSGNTYIDYCAGGSVNEYFCNGTVLDFNTYGCPTGSSCYDGVCVNSGVSVSCVDDDDLNANISVNGAIFGVNPTGNLYSVSDQCIVTGTDANTLREYSCTSTKLLQYSEFNCTSLGGICTNGICTTPTSCTPNWQCGAWSACTNNQQTRTCTDANNCGTTTGKPATNQSCTTTATCTDSDNGNFSIMGTLTLNSSGALTFYNDVCNSAGNLVESYCSGNFLGTNTLVCSSIISGGICSDGRCTVNGSTATSCIDSDGGSTYNIRGNVSLNGVIEFDQCANDNIVIETLCINNASAIDSHLCPDGCSNGVCLISGNTTQNSTRNDTLKSASWASVSSDHVYLINAFDNEFGIRSIEFSVDEDGSNISVNVTRVTSIPSSIDEPASEVYKYFRIDERNLEEILDEATIKFRVTKSWITSRGITASDIALFHYGEDDEEWDRLDTDLISSDSTYNNYEATTNSFSYFAVGKYLSGTTARTNQTNTTTTGNTNTNSGNTGSDNEFEDTTDTTDEEDTLDGEDATSGGGKLIIYTIIFVFLMLIIGLIVFLYWNNRSSSRRNSTNAFKPGNPPARQIIPGQEGKPYFGGLSNNPRNPTQGRGF